MKSLPLRMLQKGFSIIELMLGLTIIAILAALALPMYQDYTVRTKVIEGLTLLEGAKSAFSERYLSSEGNAIVQYTGSGSSPVGSYGYQFTPTTLVDKIGIYSVTAGTPVAGDGIILLAFNTRFFPLTLIALTPGSGIVNGATPSGLLNSKYPIVWAGSSYPPQSFKWMPANYRYPTPGRAAL